MKNIITTFSSFVLIFYSLASSAADIGIAASFEQPEKFFYLPIEMNDAVQITPFIHYRSNELRELNYSTKSKRKVFGVGFFYFLNSAKNNNKTTRFYLGLRLAYSTYSFFNKSTFTGNVSESETETKNTSIAPTMGLDFFLSKKMSISVDISLERIRSNQKYRFQDNNTSQFNQSIFRTTQSSKRLIIVYHF